MTQLHLGSLIITKVSVLVWDQRFKVLVVFLSQCCQGLELGLEFLDRSQ